MIVTAELSELPPSPTRAAVVSIGVFDGVHLGHAAILAENVARSRALGAVPTVVTFRQHPKTILLGRAPRTLTTLEHRLELFARAGIEHTLALHFDEALRDTPAQTFVEQVLVGRLGARSFVLGFDSKFGRGREGTPELLLALGYDVVVAEKVVVNGRAVSSSAIREAVELGDLGGAARMLGRRVAVFGEVVHGAELGRRIGFPTANLDLHHELHPPPGVYACFAHRIEAEHASGARLPLLAACNIGFRPTVVGTPASVPTVEVHLLDFESEIYGEHLELQFVERIRSEQRFPDLAALEAQIGRDIGRARELLAAQLAAPVS